MNDAFHSTGHDRGVRLGTLSKVGLGLIALGVPCMLIGVGLFASVLFTSRNSSTGVEFSPAQLVLGVVTIALGCFCAMIGLPTLFAAHADKLAERFPKAPISAVHTPNKLKVRSCKGCGRPHL
jgi:hypothetical protein